MKSDGILTFTAKYKEALNSELREVLEQYLRPEEVLIFLDFASLKKGWFKRPAFLVLTSGRFLLFQHQPFQLKEEASVPWEEIISLKMREYKGWRIWDSRDKIALLKYTTPSGKKELCFHVGKPGAPDKTETLVNNLSKRCQIGENQVFTIGDTIIISGENGGKHTRLRRWVFDIAPAPQGEGVLVLLTNESVLRQRLHNLLYLDLSGEVVWRADLPTSRGIPDSYLKIEVDEDRILGHTWSGLRCELNHRDGCIVDIQRIPGSLEKGKTEVDIPVLKNDGEVAAMLFYAGEDRMENRLYRLFVRTSQLFKERLFGGKAFWSPDDRFLAVQEVFLTNRQGIQSVGVVVFDLEAEKEALVEKSVSRSFAPQGWAEDGDLLYGKGDLATASEVNSVSMDKVFWLPLQNRGCSERTRKY